MSDFNKQDYWKNRNNVESVKDPNGKVIDKIRRPLRGQGKAFKIEDAPLARFTEDDYKAGKCHKDEIGSQRTSGVEMRMTKAGLVAAPRRDRRVRSKTKHIDKYHPHGISYSSKGVTHVVNPPHADIMLPITRPDLTNHTRMKMRAQFRATDKKVPQV